MLFKRNTNNNEFVGIDPQENACYFICMQRIKKLFLMLVKKGARYKLSTKNHQELQFRSLRSSVSCEIKDVRPNEE